MAVVHATQWYVMDHIEPKPSAAGSQEPDMKHLIKPRGRGYSFRMVTPEVLVGTENPWTGKPFGKEIKLGLHTQRHAEAVRLRDVRLGQVRQLEADALASNGRKSVGRIIDLSPENAAEWREAYNEQPDAVDFVLGEKLEKAAEAGFEEQAQDFGKMVFRGALPIDKALEMYLEERSAGNPYGYDPLAVTTALNARCSQQTSAGPIPRPPNMAETYLDMPWLEIGSSDKAHIVKDGVGIGDAGEGERVAAPEIEQQEAIRIERRNVPQIHRVGAAAAQKRRLEFD